MKKCALVVRVSSKKQGEKEDSSPDNQLTQLRAAIDFHNLSRAPDDDLWEEFEKPFIMKGVPGSKSLRSEQMSELRHAVISGKVDIIMATALDRVSRNVKDFLEFVEFLNTHNVDLICIRQNIDTHTPAGRMIMTLLMALAEFEREMTSERVTRNVHTRAKKGLWNGGNYPLGYDPNPDPKKAGVLVVNNVEAKLVNEIFDLYLEKGSFTEVAKELTSRGNKTKTYKQMNGITKHGVDFSYNTVRSILENHAYIGFKEVNKQNRNKDQGTLPEKKRYETVPAAWDPIVDASKFDAVQALIRKNIKVKGNTATTGAQSPCRTYTLAGMVTCGECGKSMEVASGTGRSSVYYYYKCMNKDCRRRQKSINAEFLEESVYTLIRDTSIDDESIKVITRKANASIENDYPVKLRELDRINKKISRCSDIINSYKEMIHEFSNEDAKKDLISDIEENTERRKTYIEQRDELIQQLENLKRERLSEEDVRKLLKNINIVIQHLSDELRRRFLEICIDEVRITNTEVEVGIVADKDNYAATLPTNPRRFEERLEWYARQDSNPEPSGP